jgi:hypothetical protein
MLKTARAERPATVPPPGLTPRRWLLFVHQAPPSPSNLRVRTWRRLQQLGALPVKQAVYALPDTPATREDFEWLKTEVKDAGGDASVFAADNIDPWSDDALVEAFRRARQEAYDELAREIQRVLSRVNASRRPRGTRAPAVGRLVELFRGRLSALERIDFFGSAGRDRAVSLVAQLDDRARAPRPTAPRLPAGQGADPASFTNRLWVTRPRPGVDRMSSAWLIRRFVDPSARFAFAPDRDTLPAPDALPFDMFGVEFGHHGDGCTFETLCTLFGIHDPAAGRVAAIVHDLDLKDARFGAPETTTIGTLIEGLEFTTTDDDALLERGIMLFESLYLAFAQTAPAARSPVATSRSSSAVTAERRAAARRRRV